VAFVALLVNGLSLAASRLWAVPDSLRYIRMAVDIAERFDLSSEDFLFRTPGYPGLLAGVFVLFGSNSPMAVLVVQHALVVAAALLTALIAWHLTSRPAVALLSGVLCACSLQLTAFANVIMSEVPYTFALVASVYFLVKYHRIDRLRFLALASLMAGVSYLFRPTGLTVVGLCVVAAVHRGAMRRGMVTPPGLGTSRGLKPAAGHTDMGRLRRVLAGVVVASGPALVVVVPCMIHNALAHGGQLLNHSMGFALYNRAAYSDRLPLDSPDSPALTEIREVMAEAKRLGYLGPNADAGSAGAVCKAYRSVHNASFAQACQLVTRAAWDLVRMHPRTVAERTLRYAAWTLLVPDSTYRFQPGGVKGSGCRRAQGADIFDVGTYQTDPQPYGDSLREFARYLPLTTEPRPLTPLWTAITRWYYRHIDAGPPILGWATALEEYHGVLGDSPYQAYVLLCVFGGLCALVPRRRVTWLLVSGVIATQVVGSVFLGGSMPRYGVPIHPLMNLYAALVLVAIARAAAGCARYATQRTRQR
jgi:hypothetical protein